MTIATLPSSVINTPTDNLSAVLARFRGPNTWHSAWQVASTFTLYLLNWWLMWYSLSVSYGLTLALATVQAGLTIRLFVIHHDCGHGSFFRSRRLSDLVGFVFGTLTLTPYRSWQWSHARHHATSGNLDRRGHGDVLTVTVAEYRRMSPARRLGYRLFRNPVVLFGVMPMLLFVIVYRFPNTRRWGGAEGWSGVMPTNLALLAAALLLSWWIGWETLLFLAAPVVLISTTL
ncbi:MAG TPA: fatty acid desaturase, partial [Phycisphaerae bacterium]|nr:fatty acid desaturase [Phycisphaerae bacterium]